MENAVEASLDFWLTMGRYADKLQRNLSEYLGVRRTSLVGSGSAANLVAVSALTSPSLGERALQPGDEIITTACAFPTTVNPIVQNGCVAVLVDTDPGSGNVDVAAMEAALTERTRGVILAHALGNPFDVAAVTAFCRRHDLWLIEDACDALGSLYDGRPVGSFGDLSTLSFYPAHHITTGEGGAVNVVSDTALMRVVESVRDWGRDCWCKSGQDNVCGARFSLEQGELPRGYDHKFVYSHVGYNLKPTDWQAAIGCAQFEKLDHFNAARRRNWAHLREVFADYEEYLELPYPEPRSDPSWFGFKILVRPDAPFDRTALVSHLEAQRVQTRMIFAGNIARQPAYVDHPLVRPTGDLGGADRIMASAFFIGVYPGNTDAHVERVADVMRDFGRTGDSDPHALRLAARELSPRREATRARPEVDRGESPRGRVVQRHCPARANSSGGTTCPSTCGWEARNPLDLNISQVVNASSGRTVPIVAARPGVCAMSADESTQPMISSGNRRVVSSPSTAASQGGRYRISGIGPVDLISPASRKIALSSAFMRRVAARTSKHRG